MACKRIVKNNLNFVSDVETYYDEMEELNSMTGIYHNHGAFKSKTDFQLELIKLVMNKRIVDGIQNI